MFKKCFYMLICLFATGTLSFSNEGLAQNDCFENCKGQGYLDGYQAPDFKITTIEGERLSLKGLKGSVVVLNFWFIACKPCVDEIPELNQLVDKYKEQNVVFIALTPFNSPQEIKTKFLTKYDFKYNIAADKNATWIKYCARVFPSNFVIDKTGKVELAFSGQLTDTYYKKMTTVIDHSLEKE